MAVVVDTCVISEIAKGRPDRAVFSWFERHYRTCLISAPVIMELETGIRIMKDPVQAEALRQTIDMMIARLPELSQVAFDEAAAKEAAQIVAHGRRAGRPMSALDAQIMGIAAAMRCAVATRESNFEGRGVEIVNPWLV